MSTSTSPTSMILLAALGVGAFWFMSQRARAAAPVYVTPQQQTQASKTKLISQGLGLLGGLLGSARAGTTQTAAPMFDMGAIRNSLAWRPGDGAEWAGLTSDLGELVYGDGLALNPPGAGVYDYIANMNFL